MGTIAKEEATAAPEVIVPVCTLQLKVEYNASMKDQRLLLSEKYNAAVARQTVAVDKLRKIAISVERLKCQRQQQHLQMDHHLPTKNQQSNLDFFPRRHQRKNLCFLYVGMIKPLDLIHY